MWQRNVPTNKTPESPKRTTLDCHIIREQVAKPLAQQFLSSSIQTTTTAATTTADFDWSKVLTILKSDSDENSKERDEFISHLLKIGLDHILYDYIYLKANSQREKLACSAECLFERLHHVLNEAGVCLERRQSTQTQVTSQLQVGLVTPPPSSASNRPAGGGRRKRQPNRLVVQSDLKDMPSRKRLSRSVSKASVTSPLLSRAMSPIFEAGKENTSWLSEISLIKDTSLAEMDVDAFLNDLVYE